MTKTIESLKALMLHTCTSIYDEEAMTSLELSARTACKVNEVVKLTNTFVDSIPQIVREYIAYLVETGSFRIENNTLVIEEREENE